MKHLIDKNALVAIIQKRFDEYSSSILRHYDACTEARASELGKILTILDTLEVKEFQKNNLFVVTRCEEHSDYVEKVFFSKEKAEEYCKQFEGNEDAYGRDITEIKVDCPILEVKEVDLEKELNMYLEVVKATDEDIDFVDFAKHFFELGMAVSNKAQKGE